MKQKLLSLLLGVALMLVFTAPALAQGPFGDDGRVVFGENFTLESGQSLNGDLVVFGGNVTTEADSTVNGNLAVFGGNVTMEGTVDGDVAAIGGNVTINGKIEGDIASLGGNVTVSESADIQGDIASFGGRVDIAEGASVDGDVKEGLDSHGDNSRGDEQHRAEPPIPPVPPQPDFSGRNWDNEGFSFFGTVASIIGEILWTTVMLFILGLISWLVAAFMPEQILNVRRTISDSTALSFGLGFITNVVAIVVGVVLLITICLAFIPILAYIFLAIAALFGWIVIGHMLGERLLEAIGRRDSGIVMSSVVGVVVLTLLTNMPVIGSIPCIGWIFGFVGWIIGTVLMFTGLGAVLLTRFGFREYPTAPGYSAPSGGPSPSAGGGTYTPNRPRWTDPAPDVSDDDPIASEEELRAKIKEALAEADELKYAPKPQPAPAPEEPAPEPEPPAGDAPETPAGDEPGDTPKGDIA